MGRLEGKDRDRHRRLQRDRRRDGARARRRGRTGDRRRAPRRAARDRRRARARRHRPGELRALRRRGRPGGHPRQRRRARARAGAVHGLHRGGRADRLRDERERPRADDAPRAAAHAARAGPHRQHRLDRRPLGLPERRDLRHLEVRGARLHARAARGPARPRHPRHHRRRRASSRPSSRSSASAATRRRRSRSTRARDRSAPTTSPTRSSIAVTRPAHVVVDELVAHVDRPVERRAHQPPQA